MEFWNLGKYVVDHRVVIHVVLRQKCIHMEQCRSFLGLATASDSISKIRDAILQITFKFLFDYGLRGGNPEILDKAHTILSTVKVIAWMLLPTEAAFECKATRLFQLFVGALCFDATRIVTSIRLEHWVPNDEIP